MIIIKNIPIGSGEKVSRNDVAELLKLDNIGGSIPSDAVILGKGELTLEGLPGYWAKYRAKITRVRLSMEMEAMMYVVFYKNKMIMIQGSNMLSVSGEKVPNGGISKYERLFDMVANSFVIEDLYR